MRSNKKIFFKMLRYTSLILIIAFGLISIVATGGGGSGDDWEYIGDEQVMVLELRVDDSSSTQDILTITIHGTTKSFGELSNCDIEAERSPMSVTLTVWAEVRKWVGSGVVPPYDTTILCDYQALPPFEEGEFFIIIQQPDGSQLTDSVLILN